MRLDTTVVETNIHYPTDSSLLGDGARVLLRAMKRIAQIACQQGAQFRDRSRSVTRRILELGRVTRTRGGPNRERLQQGYAKLFAVVGRVVGQAKRFSTEIAQGVKQSTDVIQAGVFGGAAERTGHHRAARAAGDPAGQTTGLRRRHPRPRETGEHLRAGHGSHSQGQGEQANRVWQDGQDPGSRESDHHRLCRVCQAAQRLRAGGLRH